MPFRKKNAVPSGLNIFWIRRILRVGSRKQNFIFGLVCSVYFDEKHLLSYKKKIGSDMGSDIQMRDIHNLCLFCFQLLWL